MDTRPSSRSVLSAVLLALIFAVLPLPHAAGKAPVTATLLLLHTNDIHSHLLPDDKGIGGLARIGGYVEQIRSERNDVLFLDAGDGVTGTPVSSIFRGRPVFHVMSAMGVDASALGNHEFDNGWKIIEEYRRIATFPLLCANARGPEDQLLGDAEWMLFDVRDLKIGVIGLLTETTPQITAGGVTDGVTFTKPAAAVRRLLPKVRKVSDLVVVLSHLGHKEDQSLAAEVGGIDVIVGGHSHTVVPKPVFVNGTAIVQAGDDGRYVGHLEITIDVKRRKVVDAKGRLIRVDDSLPVSPKVRAAVAIWEDRVSKRVDVVIGTATRPYGRRDLRARIEKVYREKLGTDFAFQNNGGIRANLAEGDIRIRDIWNILPFENSLVTLKIRGARLPKWAVKQTDEVDPERIYTVATNSFVAAHTDKYFAEGVEGSVDSGLSMRDVMIEYVKEHGSIE